MPKDRSIAEEALKLLTHDEREPLKWKMVLKAVGKRIKDRMINDWSVNFYRKIGERSSDSQNHLFAELQRFLEQISEVFSKEAFVPLRARLEEALIEEQNKIFETLKEETDALYHHHSPTWDRHLDPSGAGIIDYLRTLTKTTLRGI